MQCFSLAQARYSKPSQVMRARGVAKTLLSVRHRPLDYASCRAPRYFHPRQPVHVYAHAAMTAAARVVALLPARTRRCPRLRC